MHLAGPYIHMALMMPIIDIDNNKSKYSRDGLMDEDVQDISFQALMLAAMEYVIQATPDNGAPREDLCDHIISTLEGMKNDLTPQKAVAVADIVIERLNNMTGKAFETRYFNPETQKYVPFQFRYMSYEQDSMNNTRFRLAPEGYAIYYALNNTIPIDDPGLESAVMAVMLEKGSADHVLARARQSKIKAFELYQQIQNMINRAHRNPDKIDWTTDVEPLLTQATELLAHQQNQDTLHLEKARVRLDLSEDEQSSTANAWRQIMDIIEKTAAVRMGLNSYILKSYKEYLQAKLRCLEIRPKSALACLETDILPQLLTYTMEELDTLSEEWLPMFMPPQRWPSLDLVAMEDLLLVEVQDVKAHAAHQSPVLVDPLDVKTYPAALRESTQRWLDDYTKGKTAFTFSEGMQDFCQTQRTYEEQYFFAWTVFNKFNTPVFNNSPWSSVKGSVVWDHDYLCSDEITFMKDSIV